MSWRVKEIRLGDPSSVLISMEICSRFFMRSLGLIASTLSNLQTIFGDLAQTWVHKGRAYLGNLNLGY